MFISSTFEDLKDERRAVQDVIISTGDFPVQMEAFPAADVDQFEFIKSLIDFCDYYVLIIAGRYGTVADDGISYTEKEFRYAVEQEVPVLVMVHDKPGDIPASKSEDTKIGKERLARFVQEASTGRLRKSWTTSSDLKLAVREALDHAKATKPRVGWVRGDAAASLATLEELNAVRKENEKLREISGQLNVEIPLPKLPEHDAHFQIVLTSVPVGYDVDYTVLTVETTWTAVFPMFFATCRWNTSDFGEDSSYWVDKSDTCEAFGTALAAEVNDGAKGERYKISEYMLTKLMAFYIESGLMHDEGFAEVAFTEHARRFARRQVLEVSAQEPFVLLNREDVHLGYKSNDPSDEIPF